MPEGLKAHAQFASDALARSRVEISGVMTKHQLKLPDRQCRMAELSGRIQDLVVILATSLWASSQPEWPRPRRRRHVLCRDLTRKLTGKRPSDSYFRAVTKLGEAIEGGGLLGRSPESSLEAILMPYEGGGGGGVGDCVGGGG